MYITSVYSLGRDIEWNVKFGILVYVEVNNIYLFCLS